MKILWLSHILPYPPVGRGVLQRSHHLLRHACGQHEVDLIAFNRQVLNGHAGEGGEAARELSRLCRRVELVPSGPERSSARWWAQAATSFFRSTPYDVNWLDSQEFENVVNEAVRGRTFDLVHVDTLGLVPYARLVQAPFVLNHHNVESHMMRRRAEQTASTVKRVYFRREARKLSRYERRVCRSAGVNVVVSDLDGRRLQEVVGEVPVTVVRNGVDVEYFAPRRLPAEADGGLVFAGGMSWYPNRDAVLHFLRDIWPALIEKDPDRELTILGKDPPPELRAVAEDDSRLKVPGFVDDVRPYVDKASIYICPIREGGGTRLKILDALAMARPLVATEFSVEGLGLTEGRHYLRAEEPAEWVRKIDLLRSDPDLRNELASAGRHFVEDRYAWKVVARELDAAYRDALNPSIAEPG